MQRGQRINGRQFFLIVFLFSIGTTILITVNNLADVARQDAWISVAIGIAISAVLVWLYNLLARLYPDMNLVKASEAAFGRWLGKAVSLSFVLFCYIGGVTALFVVGDFIKILVMPETPGVFINILFAAVIVMGTRLGIETIARAAEILFPLVAFILVFLIVFSSFDLEFKYLQPVLEAGTGSILKGALLFIGVFSLSQVALLMFFPVCLNEDAKRSRAFYTGMLCSGAVILIVVILCITVLGVGFTSENIYPVYKLARKIDIGEIIQRVEAAIAGLWIITIYYRTVIYFYASVRGLSQVLGLKDHRSIILPMGMLMVVLSLVIYPDSSYAVMWDTRVWMPYALVHGLFLPLLVLAVGSIRSKIQGSKKHPAE